MARLRIIAGEFGGRFINADVAKVTHPMGDRVRSAMFASLMSRNVLPGAKVLDAFAGTGAIGLEALSRGARSVIFLEKDRVAARVIADNIETLGVADRAKVIVTERVIAESQQQTAFAHACVSNEDNFWS